MNNSDFKELEYAKNIKDDLLNIFFYIIYHGKLDFYLNGEEPELLDGKDTEINSFVSTYEDKIYANFTISNRLSQEVRLNVLNFENEFQAKQYLNFLEEEIASLIRVIRYNCRFEAWESEVSKDRLTVEGEDIAILTESPFRLVFSIAFDFVQELKSAYEFVVEKSMEINPASIKLMEKPAHKILLLYELGVIDFLTEKYFSTHLGDLTYSDKAKLIAFIIGAPNVETVRKGISGIQSKGKDNIITKPAIRAVKASLAEFGIDLTTLKDLDQLL